MEIFKFLILGCGYKLINVSKNIKIDRKRNFVELLSFSFFRKQKSKYDCKNSSEK